MLLLLITYSAQDVRDIIAGGLFELCLYGVPFGLLGWLIFYLGRRYERRRNVRAR